MLTERAATTCNLQATSSKPGGPDEAREPLKSRWTTSNRTPPTSMLGPLLDVDPQPPRTCLSPSLPANWPPVSRVCACVIGDGRGNRVSGRGH